MIKPHEFTDKDGYVLIVKCLNHDGTGHGGFKWPQSGPVDNPHWSRRADCASGGLFGWPWGLGVGGGKDPDATAPWLVFRAKPENVIWEIEGGDKCKAVPGNNGELPEVVYYGAQAGAMEFTMAGRVGIVQVNASGSASATGERGSASATGESGSASATGWRGSASATGWMGSASATGWMGSASATGERGSASATGERGSASATGWMGSASATGERGSASATGERGSASATGWSGSASATGESGSASATGWRGSASATGWMGSASATGWMGSASATGERGMAAATGEFSTIEVGEKAIGVCTADRFFWKPLPNSSVVALVKGKPVILSSKRLKVTGTVMVEFGKIVKEWSN